jgi:hypothetical protein
MSCCAAASARPTATSSAKRAGTNPDNASTSGPFLKSANSVSRTESPTGGDVEPRRQRVGGAVQRTLPLDGADRREQAGRAFRVLRELRQPERVGREDEDVLGPGKRDLTVVFADFHTVVREGTPRPVTHDRHGRFSRRDEVYSLQPCELRVVFVSDVEEVEEGFEVTHHRRVVCTQMSMEVRRLTLLSQFARRRSRVVLVEAVRTPRKPANECARDREPEGDDGVGEVSLRPRV